MNFKEYVCFDRTIIINFPDDWIVKEKDRNLLKVSFPIGPYPILDCYINCFDNPKINTDEKIKEYILDGMFLIFFYLVLCWLWVCYRWFLLY